MLVGIYLTVIVLANLLITWLGAGASIGIAFLCIGPDLTVRDALHEQWRGDHLRLRMVALIGAGSIISYGLNANAGPIALASFVAFAAAGIADALVYQALGDRTRLLRMNGSNVVSALVDSIVFPALAFGFPLLIPIMIGQFVAKMAGGFIWSLILSRRYAQSLG